MTTETCDIVLSGKLVNGADKDQVQQKLGTLFKTTEAKIAELFTRAPVAIKKSVDVSTAQKYQRAIEKAGAECVLKTQQPPVAKEQQEPSLSLVPMPEQQAEKVEPTGVQKPKKPGYDFEITGQPDYSFLTVQIPANETLKVEASAMATMDTNIEMKTKLKGGFGRFLTGESLFINDFTAANGPGEIGIAPGAPGDLLHQYLDGNTIYLQNSAYVASTADVTVESKWQGMVKGFFSGESLFLIRCSGKGDLWFNTYGAIIEIDVEDDYVVDTGNIVAFTEGLEYTIRKVGGYKSLFFSGEGLVCRFSGKGKVWIQTRSAAAFVSWAHWFRPVKRK
ncbi:TIGR00266 family protein [Reinekea marinisedimentorum]|uniref:Uncharacterized protein (TIGR00266 family) n=1 Tax=Reinekea marinisedimentorum TaxID=230495 RepID=A0A4R3HXM6_9GAMM|nr:TIGR00266 family protein [Reinekea marinisedimentorum]TCS37594.1 uncharacterized protein (TIGR00266 family) [Reinekea marinisedimentorum]